MSKKQQKIATGGRESRNLESDKD